jgi:hypothetical protein
MARELQRWRDAVRQWVQPGALPATGEQLTAQLVSDRAPAWLVWRVNTCLHPSRVIGSVEEIVSLCVQPRRQRSAPGMPYAG